LRFSSISRAPNGTNLLLTFLAVSNFNYSIDYTDALGTSPWHTLQDIASTPTNRVLQIAVSPTGAKRYYRLRTPSLLTQGLKLNPLQRIAGNQLNLTFTASANQSYTVEYTPHLGTSAFTTLTNYPSAPTNHLIQLTAPASGSGGFFRLRSP
jgi:hypothetical protein